VTYQLAAQLLLPFSDATALERVGAVSVLGTVIIYGLWVSAFNPCSPQECSRLTDVKYALVSSVHLFTDVSLTAYNHCMSQLHQRLLNNVTLHHHTVLLEMMLNSRHAIGATVYVLVCAV